MNSSTSLCRQVCPHRCFDPGAQPVARVPTADAQLSTLFVSDEPVVGLFLFRCANVARYGLPDHRNPPSPRNVSADFIGSASTFPSLRSQERRSPSGPSHWKLLGNCPPSFHRAFPEMGEQGGKESAVGSKFEDKSNWPRGSVLKLGTALACGRSCERAGAIVRNRGGQKSADLRIRCAPLDDRAGGASTSKAHLLLAYCLARSSPSWRAPGSGGRSNRDK